jgi:hypothetical protein
MFWATEYKFSFIFKLSGYLPENLIMKFINVLLFLTVLIGSFQPLHASPVNENELREIILEDDDQESHAYTEITQTRLSNEKKIDIYNLQKAKYKLINGDLRLAEYFLSKINDQTSSVLAVKKRYLSIIYFIQGKFKNSIKQLSFSNDLIEKNPQICLLKLINYMALSDLENLNKEKELCLSQLLPSSKNDLLWLDTMIKLKNKDSTGVSRNLLTDTNSIFRDDELAKLWLKTGLYLNREKSLLELIGELTETSYQSKKLREIIAFMYLRDNNEKKALAFIEDIDTANSENVKGNLRLKNKEYELAFGHFRLALSKKQDSNNALERAIPLAWILGQWNDGLTMLSNISNPVIDKRNTHALKIAFLIREKKYFEAQKEIVLLKNAFFGEPPFEVAIMDSYVDLLLAKTQKDYDRRKTDELTEKSCRSFDGMSCWISMQLIQWDNLGKTVTRNEPIYQDKEMTIDSLKQKKTITPLEELKAIDQADIEELDSDLLNIKPQ